MIDIKAHGGVFGGGKPFNPLSFKVTENLISIDTGVTSGNVKFAVDRANGRIAYLTLAGSNRFLRVYDPNLTLIKDVDIYSIMSPNQDVKGILLDGDELYIAHGSSANYAVQKITWNLPTPTRRWTTNNAYAMGTKLMYLTQDKTTLYTLGPNIRRLNPSSGSIDQTWGVPGGLNIEAMCELNGKLYMLSGPPSVGTECRLFVSPTKDFSGTIENYLISSTQYYGGVWMTPMGNNLAYLYSQNGTSSFRLMDSQGVLLKSISSSSGPSADIAVSSKGLVGIVSNNMAFLPVSGNDMTMISFLANNGGSRYFLWVSENGKELISYISSGNVKLEKQVFKY